MDHVGQWGPFTHTVIYQSKKCPPPPESQYATGILLYIVCESRMSSSGCLIKSTFQIKV